MGVLVSALYYILGLVAVVAVLEVLLLFWVLYAYGNAIFRIFETKPLFLAHSVAPQADGEEVILSPDNRRQLRGTYFRHTARNRRGVLLFCHEFTANRWLFEPYLGYLREDGFDIFTFDFCGHGSSDPIEGYEPLQWVTAYEEQDVRCAIDYLKSREDRSPHGIGVLGVSKGGSAAIAAAAKEPFVRAIITDGAFPTHSMVTEYTMRWCVIYVRLKSAYKLLPRFFWDLLSTGAVQIMQHRHNVRYIRLERRIRKLAGRPILLINGERDPYVTPAVANRLFSYAKAPKELWLVKRAKHNGSLDADPAAYRNKVRNFFLKHLPAIEPVRTAQPEQTASEALTQDEKPEKVLM